MLLSAMSQPLRIGVLASFRYAKYRDLMRGLVADLERARHWQLRCEEPTHANLRALCAWGAAGLIVQVQRARLGDAVVATGLPAVNVSQARDEPRLPLIAVDDLAVGRAAARHLEERFVAHRAVIAGDQPFARARLAGFAGSAAPPNFPGGDLARWLAGQPRPFGLFAVTEHLAYEALAACRRAGLRVPEDVLVVAAGDDDLLCATCWPSITSVPLAGMAIGAAAAGLLERLLAGRRPPHRPVLVPPGTLVPRASTDAVACDDQLVAEVVRRMRARLAEPVGVCQLLAGLEPSRRVVEQRFARTLGCSPLQVLTRLRLERARVLLAGGASPLAAVARACGLATAEHLHALVRRHLGCTPGSLRRLG